jgi:hypothetical protein
MLFLQPVVVDDALAADRARPAEVRRAERAEARPPWTAELLAQSSIDQRSPFGTNAPNMNDGRPDFVPPRPVDPTPPGTSATGSGAFSDPTSTKIPPMSGRPDAGPPPPSGTTAVNPDRVNDLPDPGRAQPRSTPTPGATPTTAPRAMPGSGAAPGTNLAPPAAGSATTISPSGPPTLPGATSGASNTR